MTDASTMVKVLVDLKRLEEDRNVVFTEEERKRHLAALKIQRMFRGKRDRDKALQKLLTQIQTEAVASMDERQRYHRMSMHKSLQLFLAVQDNNLLEVIGLIEDEFKGNHNKHKLENSLKKGGQIYDATKDVETAMDVNYKEPSLGLTPLIIACKNGYYNIVKELCTLRPIVDVNKPDDFGMTPLMHAAKEGHLLIVELLLKSTGDKSKEIMELKAHIFERDVDGWTALLYAADAGKWPVIEFLCDNRGDLSVQTSFNETVLMKAAAGGHLTAVRYLCSKSMSIDVNYQNRQGMTALMLAAYYGRLDVVRFLGSLAPTTVDITVKNHDGHTVTELEPSPFAIEELRGDGVYNEAKLRRYVKDMIADALHGGQKDSIKEVALAPSKGQRPSYQEALEQHRSDNTTRVQWDGVWATDEEKADEYRDLGAAAMQIAQFEAATIYFERAVAFSDRHELKHAHSRARSLYKQAKATLDGMRENRRQRQADIYYNTGKRDFHNKRFKDAINMIKHACDTIPEEQLYKDLLRDAYIAHAKHQQEQDELRQKRREKRQRMAEAEAAAKRRTQQTLEAEQRSCKVCTIS